MIYTGFLLFFLAFFGIIQFMAPLPKRKHSTQRKGKRRMERIVKFQELVKCNKCGKQKLPHRVCKYCNK